jgi:phosphoglycolate phosphatase
MKTKLVIFDLDGTLIDAYPAIIDSLNYTLRKLGMPAQGRSVICRAVGKGDIHLLKPFVRSRDLKKALKIYRRHHRISLLKGSRLFPGVRRLLSYLKKRGYKIAVASNRPTEFSLILIKHLKIKKYFDYILCADRISRRKPHPQIINKIIKRFSVSPEETIYVGDMLIDIHAGKRAQVKVIAVPTGSSTIDELRKAKPDWLIKGIAHLQKLFSGVLS